MNDLFDWLLEFTVKCIIGLLCIGTLVVIITIIIMIIEAFFK